MRLGLILRASTTARIHATPAMKRRSALFAPKPLEGASTSAQTQHDSDAALAAQLAAAESSSPARYALRKRIKVEDPSSSATEASTPPVTAPLTPTKSPSSKAKGKGKADFFAISPRKVGIKNPLLPSLVKDEGDDDAEAKPAKAPRVPKNWERTLQVLEAQRRRIVAPVDTMGCEENGREDRRADKWRTGEEAENKESEEDAARRERFACLVSLMLSSQTKDPVTAQAVRNLQLNLPDGLTVDAILSASDDDISSCIDKVGFWRRKTGYLKSAARILKDDFDSDVPKTIPELLSIPGVGPKMAFLCLSGAHGIHAGIGVDVHVHRISNRLGWVKSKNPEETRVQLEGFLPKEVQQTINKTLVGFGQVVCVPVGPRCDLCELSAAKLCPSRRKVDAKAAASRVKVEMLPKEEGGDAKEEAAGEAKIKVELAGPEGSGEVELETVEGSASQIADEAREVADALGAEAVEPSTPSRSRVKDEDSPARLDW